MITRAADTLLTSRSSSTDYKKVLPWSSNSSIDNKLVNPDHTHPRHSAASRFGSRAFRITACVVALGLLLAFTSHTYHPKQQPLLRPAHGIMRDNTTSLKQYLSSQFNPDDVVYWTIATAEYVEPVRNWDAKRAELGMPDNIVVICLDEGCMDRVDAYGGRAYGGYSPAYITLPPASPPPEEKSLKSRVKRSGAERGQYMSFVKFTALVDMSTSGYSSLFFEGDTFILDDPFKHMLPLSREDWDMQFMEDFGQVMNFGWIFARGGSKGNVAFWQLALERYIDVNVWDQELVSDLIEELQTEENNRIHKRRELPSASAVDPSKADPYASDHWRILGSINVRIHMIPMRKFLAQHIISGNRQPYGELSENASEQLPVMRHLSAVQWANRMFWPREKGWYANIDGYYTNPRPIITTPPFSGTLQQLQSLASLMSSVAYATNHSYMIPEEITAFFEGQVYRRDYTRILSIRQAMTNNTLSMREADFFLHAKRYLSPDVHKEWTSAANRVIVDVRQFSNVTSLVSFISELPENPYRVVDLRFLGQSKSFDWSLDPLVDVPRGLRDPIHLCGAFQSVPQPYQWCNDFY